MTDLTSLTLAEARSGLVSKSFTSLELTDAHLQAIEAARVLNAFVMETPDQARAMAREADARIIKGEGGPLAGIPLGIKDLFATKDVRTTAGSKILGNFVPTYESSITSQLWRDGAVMLGKLNMDEFQLWTFLPSTCDYVGTLGESLSVYYCVDEWSKFSYVDGPRVAKADQKLCRRADVVFATAQSLVEARIPENPNTQLARHGVDLAEGNSHRPSPCVRAK
jgi:hypothetical protein